MQNTIYYSVDYTITRLHHYCSSKSAEALSLNVTHNWFDDILNVCRNFLFLSLVVSWTWWHSKSVIHCSTTDWSLVEKIKSYYSANERSWRNSLTHEAWFTKMILLTYLFTYLLRTTMSSVVINSDGSTGQGGFSYLLTLKQNKAFCGRWQIIAHS